jgi:hypothetical protein
MKGKTMNTKWAVQALLCVGALLANALFAPIADARSVTGTKVKTIYIKNTGTQNLFTAVQFVNTLGTKPACVTALWTDYLAFDPNSARGGHIMTMLSAALLSGRRIDAYGTGNCVTVAFGAGTASVEELEHIDIFND